MRQYSYYVEICPALLNPSFLPPFTSFSSFFSHEIIFPPSVGFYMANHKTPSPIPEPKISPHFMSFLPPLCGLCDLLFLSPPPPSLPFFPTCYLLESAIIDRPFGILFKVPPTPPNCPTSPLTILLSKTRSPFLKTWRSILEISDCFPMAPLPDPTCCFSFLFYIKLLQYNASISLFLLRGCCCS